MYGRNRRQMVILSSLVFTLFTEQFIFVNPNLSPAEPVDNDDPFSHLKRLVVKLPSTEGVGNNQNANVKVLSLQGFQNLPAAEIVGPRSCPFYHVTTVESQYLKRMKKLWIVARVVPKGQSTYADKTAACGLHNFVRSQCRCLRYYLDFEKDETITIQSMSLHNALQSYRYIENRLVFIDKKYDILQGQHLYSAIINATNLRVSPTLSPLEEELYPEFEPFALLGTDNYDTYAVYAACTHNTATPLAWIAFAEKAYINGISRESVQAASEALVKNGISISSTVFVDQRKCLNIVVDNSNE